MNMRRIKLGKKKTKIGTGNELKPLFVNFFFKKTSSVWRCEIGNIFCEWSKNISADKGQRDENQQVKAIQGNKNFLW